MDLKKANVDNLFIRHQIIKLKLIKEAVENPGKKIPPAREIAKENDISELTVKKVEKELALKGYIVSNKKGGTRTLNKFAKEQISSFVASKETFRGIVDNLMKNGFSKEDIMALVYDVLSEIKDDLSLVVYTEKDEGIAIYAKRELERNLGANVVFKPFDTLKTELMNKVISNKIVVAPFYCFPQLEVYKYEDVKMVPLKAIHPLEFISLANDIPFASRIFYVAASKLDKENAMNVYYNVLNNRYRVYIYTQDELLTNRHLLNFADIVVGFHWVLESDEFLFKGVKRVVKTNRFDDDEGIRMIKSYIEELTED